MSTNLQLSTFWFRLKRIEPTTLSWWQDHRRELPKLGEQPVRVGRDEQTDAEVARERPDFLGVDLEASERGGNIESSTVAPGTFAWIKAETREDIPCVAFDQGEKWDDLWYDLDSAYEEARENLDVSLSPHTAFRELEAGDNLAAIEFLQRFGPLESPGSSLNQKADAAFLWDYRGQWLNLDHFWARHRRFVAIAKLWEATLGNSPQRFPAAWVELVDALDQINQCAPPLLDPHSDARIENWLGFPGIQDKEKFNDWLKHPGKMGLSREIVLGTIQQEINANAVADLRPWWHQVQKDGRPAFALALRTMSLWGAMWQFFARDTLGLGWRICPHCNKVFYPPRKDRFFCTPELQQLHSKVRWARKNRRTSKRRTGAKRG
jgi:hypothetical protein